ncbi:syndecan-2 [Latimeria chalumnae]|uniref:Syndecan n=1 Tax=Latimeria chalumnae TaxID=7897 RepID=H3AML5_LATCH|nr:PREDICTED: syndecan-2 [Latimeria chalumnae]|eukprot:XP_006005106.1 PREDICTED: syndecan-2 [Latimeria chalumnae]
MRNARVLLTFGLAVFVLGELNLVKSEKTASPSQDKDLYLDDETSSGDYPVDDDDYSSGSGSGSFGTDEEVEILMTQKIPEVRPTIDATKIVETSTMKKVKMPARTEAPVVIGNTKETDNLGSENKDTNPGVNVIDTDVSAEKRSENLFQRTEVLAAVIAGGVIGFLFAIFLILLLVYRMRKKDEGSYALGERKPSSAAYQKAPTKEFYA